MSNQVFPGSEDTIPEQEAIDITTNWRDFISAIDPASNYIRAFNIPMIDIQELAQFYQCPSVRAYLAMTIPGDSSSLKIILVPVDKRNQDILSVPSPHNTEQTLSTEQSSIYDLTSPCPQICDIDSPLFTGS
ncbi:MAG: hypothetical protein ABI685_04850 [Ferruginibacter sp.]